MTAYVDSSVILRVAFGEPKRLVIRDHARRGVACEIVRLECLRTIDRMRIRLHLDDEETARRTEAVFEMLDRLDLIRLTEIVLERASQPFPTALGSLDAIHLASALLWQQSEDESLLFLTHDVELARAARTTGFSQVG